MKEARKRGDLTIRERPDSPEWEFCTQKITCIRTFEGIYADLLAKVPKVGTSMQGYANELLIENVKLKKAISGKATMIVMLEVSTDSATSQFPEPVQPVYEVEWAQLERPIEQHPFFKNIFPDPKNPEAFSDDQIAALNNFLTWENTTEATSRKTAYAALSDAFKKLALKKMGGTTTYMLFAPVARITTLARNVTPAGACGKIYGEVPNFYGLPSGYEWLSSADRSTRTGTNGKWQRVQEWTGATVWDGDLYKDHQSNTSGGEEA